MHMYVSKFKQNRICINEWTKPIYAYIPLCNLVQKGNISHLYRTYTVKLPTDTQYATGVLRKWYFESKVNWLKHSEE